MGILYGMQKIYRIKLSAEERNQLEQLPNSRKKVAALKVTKARALLLADESEGGPALRDPDIINATGIKPATLSRLRQRVCEVGPIQALERKVQAQPSRKAKIDGEVEARLATIACSQAPEGRKRWTLRLMAERMVELEIVDSISHEAVRKALKKTTLNPG